MALQLSTRVARLETLASALAFVDLLVISVWMWDLFSTGQFTIFDSLRAYFAFGAVMMLLGCLGFVLLHRVAQRDNRHPLLVCLGAPSALVLLLPPGTLMMIVSAARGLHAVAQ